MNRLGLAGLLILIAMVLLGMWYWATFDASPPMSLPQPASKDDLIRVNAPLPNTRVQSPLTISGEARGPWYFEASFPVKLIDSNGNVLAQAPAQAQGEWMTSEYVPFSVTLTFAAPTTATGTLILMKDNPSGLPQNDNQLEIPVVFRAPSDSFSQDGTGIKLYFYNSQLDQGPGGAQCTRNGLVAVDRVMPKTTTPLTDAIKFLLRGELSSEEHTQGITTEFPLPGVALTSASITNGVATLTFVDPQHKTGGGSCRVAVLWAQIEATAKQFPNVKSVRFMPEDLFQP